MKTTSLKGKDIEREWLIIDASGERLGNLASAVASYLKGKRKVSYSPYLDCGDYVVVVNAKNVEVHPSKKETKMYYSHSGFPGGFKKTTFAEMMRRKPTNVVSQAVKGMLPGTKLGNTMFKKLFVYEGEEHPHNAQKPKKITLDRDIK